MRSWKPVGSEWPWLSTIENRTKPTTATKTFRLDNVTALQAFQVMQYGTSALIAILLAKSSWGLEQIAIYEALMFLGALYSYFWLVGGSTAILQLFPRLDSEQGRRALFNTFCLFCIAGLLTGAAIYLSADHLIGSVTRFDHLPHVQLLAVYIALNCPSALLHLYYLLLGRYRSILIFGFTGFSLQLLAVGLPVLFDCPLSMVLKALCVWAAFKLVWTLSVVWRHTELRLDGSFIRRYVWLSLPLMLIAFVGKGIEYVSTFLVTVLNEEETAFAIYRYGARELPLGLILLSSLGTALLPVASRNMDEGLRALRTRTRNLSHWLFPVSIAMTLASPILFPLVFSPAFKESAFVFNTLGLYLICRIPMPHVVTMAAGHNYAATANAVLEFLLVGLFSYLLGRWFGLVGIAMGTVLAFLCDRIALISYNWKVLGIPPSRYVDFKTYVPYSLLLVAAYLIAFSY